MKFLASICSVLLFTLHLPVQAQKQTPRVTTYSVMWKPISPQEIAPLVKRYRNNGLMLDQTLFRAQLYNQSKTYLVAISAAKDKEPKNANLLAAHALTLLRIRSSEISGKPSNMSETLRSFNKEKILEQVERAKQLNSRCWLAYLAQSKLEPGGFAGQRLHSVQWSQKAYQIQRNGLTMKTYAKNLMFEGALMSDVEQIKQAQVILIRAYKLYPRQVDAGVALFQAYRGQPNVMDKKKATIIAQKLVSTIPPGLRKRPEIGRYLKYMGVTEYIRL